VPAHVVDPPSDQVGPLLCFPLHAAPNPGPPTHFPSLAPPRAPANLKPPARRSSLFRALRLSRAPSRPALSRRQLTRSLGRRTPRPSPSILKPTPPLPPSPVSRASAPPRSNASHASPLRSPFAAAEGPKDHRSRCPPHPPSPPEHRRPKPTLPPSVAPLPRCVSVSPTLPGTSPFSCVSYPHRFPYTWSPGWTPPRAWPPRGDHG
jgi:hypothetical protein